MKLTAGLIIVAGGLLMVGSGTVAASLLRAAHAGRAGTLAAAPAATATLAASPNPSPSQSASATASQTASPGSRPRGATLPTGDIQPNFPIRAAFYYPWFPQAWQQQGLSPFTHYHPSAGFYDSGSAALIDQHLAAMRYANIQVGIASWWGQGSHTDQRISSLLTASRGSAFRWALYYEPEGQGDPTVDQIRADLGYIAGRYGRDPAYLRIGGRFVVFVYAQPADSCAMAARWKQANTVGAYVILKDFPGYQGCVSQPDGWHQYAPAAEESRSTTSFSISPGFFKAATSNPLLDRDLVAWETAVRDMVASHAVFQLVTTFNEWGEGTAVESAAEWASPSGYGAYLDILHKIP